GPVLCLDSERMHVNSYVKSMPFSRSRRETAFTSSPTAPPASPPASPPTASPPPAVSRAVHTVPLGVPFYLSCPIDSYHATYTWQHDEHSSSSPCLQMGPNCLHLIPSMEPGSYGRHQC
ncbi:hypothetical protein CRUP_018636, partial [Coryphaenoides rupestris]